MELDFHSICLPSKFTDGSHPVFTSSEVEFLSPLEDPPVGESDTQPAAAPQGERDRHADNQQSADELGFQRGDIDQGGDIHEMIL
jgi:hypothetical protein